MDESFELPVTYGGKDLVLPARLTKRGYVYRIELELNGTPVYFERDEDQSWRALIDPDTAGAQKVDANLVRAVMEVLQSVS